MCAASIIRVIAFNQFDIRDPTYTSVGTATWSSVEQSLAIVCAGLITMRPLLGRVFSGVSSSKINTDGGSHPRPADVHLSEMGITRSRWRPSAENESRVGFARLPEDVLAPSAESHELSYPPIGAAVSSAAGPGSKADEVVIVPSAIVKKMEIEQRTDSIYGPAQ